MRSRSGASIVSVAFVMTGTVPTPGTPFREVRCRRPRRGRWYPGASGDPTAGTRRRGGDACSATTTKAVMKAGNPEGTVASFRTTTTNSPSPELDDPPKGPFHPGRVCQGVNKNSQTKRRGAGGGGGELGVRFGDGHQARAVYPLPCVTVQRSGAVVQSPGLFVKTSRTAIVGSSPGRASPFPVNSSPCLC